MLIKKNGDTGMQHPAINDHSIDRLPQVNRINIINSWHSSASFANRVAEEEEAYLKYIAVISISCSSVDQWPSTTWPEKMFRELSCFMGGFLYFLESDDR